MQAKAVTKYVRISPTKVRPVMDLVRGKPVDRALAILRYLPHKAAREIARTIESARANATNNYDMVPDALIVKYIFADEGPAFKRIHAARPRSSRSHSQADDPYHGDCR